MLLQALGPGQARFVGGAVRDSLLGLEAKDLDVATPLSPYEVMRALGAVGIKVVPTGITHGTVTAISDGQVVEITTLRSDVTTDGRRATVAFTDDWQQDAARRDFTINALFADPQTGELFDYFDGLADLRDHRVRFIGDPLTRIAEDHLRILRFFRFHARFGKGQPDEAGLRACVLRANDLMALSRERIADELLKLLAHPDPAATVSIMVEHGVLASVLPEIEQSALPRLERLVQAEQQSGIVPDGLRRLASLIPCDPALAEKIAARLKLSNRDRKRLASAVQAELDLNPRALSYRIGTESAIDRLLLAGLAEQAASVAHWDPPRLPIGGGVLIHKGLAPGPAVAKTLKIIEHQWVERGFPQGPEFDAIVSEVLAAEA
ncbi:CCA tRNA nucleotidyltransferase [Sphingomonas arenae]|uniref:CCA tRNA nucleotidyltransferase n=1 Tax=Sphingomonas arenae TaxID=2812555 RepID=UPI001967EA99|nr:CCA tRNA nucleotidyltransferase [Sphingomonas arenae]